MSRIVETLVVEVSGRTVQVVIDGIKKMSEHNNGMNELKAWLAEQIASGKVEGSQPYANFEASITWKLVDEYRCGSCHKKFYLFIKDTPETKPDLETGEDYPVCPECEEKDKEAFRKEMMGGSLLDIFADAFKPEDDE